MDAPVKQRSARHEAYRAHRAALAAANRRELRSADAAQYAASPTLAGRVHAGKRSASQICMVDAEPEDGATAAPFPAAAARKRERISTDRHRDSPRGSEHRVAHAEPLAAQQTVVARAALPVAREHGVVQEERHAAGHATLKPSSDRRSGAVLSRQRPADAIDGSGDASRARPRVVEHPHVEVVRGKAREALHGYACTCCSGFLQSVANNPIELARHVIAHGGAHTARLASELAPSLLRTLAGTSADAHLAPPTMAGVHAGERSLADAVSRHRARWQPAETPPGYWQLDSLPEADF